MRLVGSIAITMMTMTQFIAVCIVLAVGLMMMKRTLMKCRSMLLRQHQQGFVSGLSTQVVNKIWLTLSVQLHFKRG